MVECCFELSLYFCCMYPYTLHSFAIFGDVVRSPSIDVAMVGYGVDMAGALRAPLVWHYGLMICK